MTRAWRLLVALGLAATAAASSSCTVKDPLFCDPTHPCTDPSRPYCDLSGQYEEDHIRNTCVPSPFAVDAPVLPTPDGPPDAPPDAMLDPANLTINESMHDFADVVVGSESFPATFTIHNTGQLPSTPISVTIDGAAASSYVIVPTGTAADCAGQSLAPKDACTVQVKFHPQLAMAGLAGTLHVDAAQGGNLTVMMTGNGQAPGSLEVTAGSSIDFGALTITSSSAPQTITIHNLGGVAVTNLAVTLHDTTNYAQSATTCGTSLAAGATCDISIKFNPTTVGGHQSSVTVSSDQGTVAPQIQGVGTADVQVTKAGTGTGTIADTLSTPILSCGTSCTTQTKTYSQTPITLSAAADPTSVFDGWGGACAGSGTNPSCSLDLTQALTNVSATFTHLWTLDVTVAGAGEVTATGIDCPAGGACAHDYRDGTMVVLTATPGTGGALYAWSGVGISCSATSNMCTVPMTAARSVTVTFKPQWTVSLTLGGTGAGTVTGGPFNCSGGTCTATVFDGTAMTLAETPGTAAVGSQDVFSTWGGACTGTAATCDLTITGNTSVTAQFALQHRLTLSLAGSGGGSVADGLGFTCAAGTCTHFYDVGTVLNLTPTPDATSVFSAYSGACTGPSCTVTMDAPKSVTATFTHGYTLAVTVAGSGTVTSAPVGINCGAACSYLFGSGTTVTLTASPSAGYGVLSWAGGTGANCVQDSTTCTVDMTQARNVTVTFQHKYTLTVNKTGSGSGTVTASGINCGATCSASYFAGTMVPVTAALGTVGTGQNMTYAWTGACTGSGACTVTMSADQTLGATFTLQNQLAVLLAGAGGGTVTDGAGFTCGGGTCTKFYDSGTAVTLTGTPDASSLFGGFTGDCVGATCGLTMSAPRNVTATFNGAFTLNVAVTGMGSVASTPAGISCGATCSAKFAAGSTVMLTATVPAGYSVQSWGGTGTTCAPGSLTCSVPMTAARNVTVTTQRQYTVTVSTGGSGTGTVSGSGSISGSQISCGATCAGKFFAGETVTLTDALGATTTGQNMKFAWSGACTGSGACSFAVSADTAVGATFTLQNQLTITFSGSGGGTVTDPVSGFTCTGGTCSRFYDLGAPATVVTLGAMADSSSNFNGYSGDCGGTSCSLTMDMPHAVTAAFGAANTLTLGVSGSGSVVSTPAGISCGSACSYKFPAATTSVTLTATPGAGNGVYAWSGAGQACAIGATTCVVDLTVSRNISVTFAPQYTVTVNKAGSGTGTVTASGNHSGTLINCGATCSAKFFSGESVALTETPGAVSAGQNMAFAWGGACSGSGACSFTLSADTAVSATFTLQNQLSLTLAGSGGGTVSDPVAGFSCSGGTCTRFYDLGTPATVVGLSATPDASSIFNGYSGDCSSTSCSLTMNAPHAVTASFGASNTLNVTVSGSGSVASTPAGISCGSTCSYKFPAATMSVTLTATPAAGYGVYAWSGAGQSCAVGATSCVVDLTVSRNISVTFAQQYTVTVSKAGSGSGTVSATGNHSGTLVTCGATCSAKFFSGEAITMADTPSAVGTGQNMTFAWGGACSGSGACGFTLTADTAVSATFTLQNLLTLTLTGTGGGTVKDPVANFSCASGTCTRYYDLGAPATVVGLTATPDASSMFNGYSGDCTGTSCSVTMNAPHTVTASFGAAHTLNVTVSGSGSVVSNPAGINCGSGCSYTYPAATTSVTLTATVPAGYGVYSWVGAGQSCAIGATSCVVDLTANRNITVTFTPMYTVTVSKSGSGSGTVTAIGSHSGALVSCGTTCSASFFSGETITMAETPGTVGTGQNIAFAWGGACSGSGACGFTLSADTTVNATFTLQNLLTIIMAGAGTGTVANGAVFSCSSGTCTHYYDYSTSAVALSEAATGNSVFNSFSGDCTGSSCSVVMTAPRSVTATFDAAFTLSVTVNGMGSVSSNPGGINCGATCSALFASGKSVILTAALPAGYGVQSWTGGTGGDCMRDSPMCTVSMTQARNVTVTIAPKYTLTINKTGSGSGTVTASGSLSGALVNCGSTCSASFFAGETITVAETPGTAGAGDRIIFGPWSGSCSGSGACAPFTINANATVGAYFELQHLLTVTFDAQSSAPGSVKDGSGFTCGGGTCTQYYPDTTMTMSLTPVTPAGSIFDGFSNACSGATCTLTMNAPRNVTVAFLYDILPSNGLITQLDQTGSAPDIVLPAGETINTDNGVISDSSGNQMSVPSFVVTQASNPSIRVFIVHSLTAHAVSVKGSASLAIVSDRDVDIDDAWQFVGAVGASGSQCLPPTSAAGGAGNSAGGGGAGGFGPGGAGGGAGGGAAGKGRTNSSGVPLIGGCSGGGVLSGSTLVGVGGSGGAAIQVVSRTKIWFHGNAQVNVGGHGGHSASSNVPFAVAGTGGGSGGNILLEAPVVTVDGASVVLAAGGGGGGSASTSSGSDGSTSGPGLGGGCSGCGVGGNGGWSDASGLVPTSPTAGGNLAGGGGAVGFVQVNNSSKVFAPTNSAQVRAALSVGTAGTR